MSIFNLPDLGEGLPDAEIHEWFVKIGDVVTEDQPLVSMETAKAIVDVPSPQHGTIETLYGQVGDIIKTGMPLLKFATEESARPDQGTVVGHLEQSTESSADDFIIGTHDITRAKATPAIRLFAKKAGIDLKTITGSGEHGIITREDVTRAIDHQNQLPEGFEPLRGVRRSMLHSMVESHQEVVPVSIFDQADITDWVETGDISVRLIKAICVAVAKEPTLNAWFHTKHSAIKCFQEINLGLAMDSADGLFVPVIHDAAQYSDEALRQIINDYKKGVDDRSLPADKFQKATITLSNFGKFSGRYASPVIVPPMVAILAVGRLFESVAMHQGNLCVRKILPLSLSFDHRAVTGGEATRFLGSVIEAIQSI